MDGRHSKWNIYGVAILLCVFIASTPCIAATYTVGPSGCDYTTFPALFSAVDLGPDDIVEARAATPGGKATFAGPITPGPDDHGSSGHPLIIRARPGDTITIKGPGDTGYVSNCIRINSSANSYITFDGFYLTNYGYAGAYIFGTSAADKVKGITVENCHATTSVDSTQTDTTECFIARYDSGLTFYKNTCHIALTTANQTDCFYVNDSDTVDFNGNTGQDDNGNGTGHNDGIQMEMSTSGASHDITVRNNKFTHTQNTGQAQQLLFFEHEIGGDNYIYNNLFYNVYGSGSVMVQIANCTGTMGTFYFYNNDLISKNGQVLFRAQGGTVYFENNLLWNQDPSGGAIISLQGATAPTSGFRNNLYWRTGGTSSGQFRVSTNHYDWSGWKGVGYDSGSGTTASYFSPVKVISTSTYPFDLHLQSDSPAINAGADLSSVFSTDISNELRPQGAWDVGAYQGSSISLPPSPTGLQIASGP